MKIEKCPYCGYNCYIDTPWLESIIKCERCTYTSTNEKDQADWKVSIMKHNLICYKIELTNEIMWLEEIEDNNFKIWFFTIYRKTYKFDFDIPYDEYDDMIYNSQRRIKELKNKIKKLEK